MNPDFKSSHKKDISNDRVGSFDGSSFHKNSEKMSKKSQNQLVGTLENRERFKETKQMLNQGKVTFKTVREVCSIFTYPAPPTELPDSPAGLKTAAQFPAVELAPDRAEQISKKIIIVCFNLSRGCLKN